MQAFKVDDVDLRIDYDLSLLVPQSVANNTNMTIQVDIQKTPLRLSVTGDGIDVFSFDGNMSMPNNFSAKIYMTQDKHSVPIKLQRNVDRHDIMRMRSMPGFNVSWTWLGINESQHPFSSQEKITVEFVREGLK